ncbi:MarR family transcriptional regulator [Enterobacterales bacterium CwR94]|nr:MarR family transcriptional regulator [Enterobacterales bacterium CwR94]
MQGTCHLQRVYAYQGTEEGDYWLVDRLWPRGISRQRLQHVVWLKAVAPSSALRQWYHQHLDAWPQFCQHYTQELQATDAWQPLVDALQKGEITLLYGSKDSEHNHAIVLRDFLLAR